MKLTFIALSSTFLFCTSFVGSAQNAAEAAKDAPPADLSSSVQPQSQNAAPPAQLMLKEGIDVKLKFAQSLSSKTAVEGDPVSLILDEALKVGEITVAKAGAKAVGTVTHTKRAGMMGKAGELNVKLEYLIIRDIRMRLRGTKGKEGEGKEGTAVALTVLFGPIGLIKHGKNVEVKEGTPLLAYVDQDFAVPADK